MTNEQPAASRPDGEPVVAEKVRKKYNLLIEPLREECRRLGYALAVHGSIARDIDLIAIPWTSDSVSPRALAESLQRTIERVNGVAYHKDGEDTEYFRRGSPGAKPHGRLGWTWHIGGTYIDLSVMPRTEPPTASASGVVAAAGGTLYIGVNDETGAMEQVEFFRDKLKQREIIPVVAKTEFDRVVERESAAQKDARRWKAIFDAQSADYQRLVNEVDDKDDAIERLGDIGKLVGCDHHDYSDGRLQLVNCVEQTIDELQQQLSAERAAKEQAEAEAAAMREMLELLKTQGGPYWQQQIEACLACRPASAALLARLERLKELKRDLHRIIANHNDPKHVRDMVIVALEKCKLAREALESEW